ncbi:16S rRNA (guanine(527)-N(7))-methyltransferase RsmG [candidate division KSB1 bacterium]
MEHNNSAIDSLAEAVRGWGIDFPEEKKELFVLYNRLLLEWNDRVHLVSSGDEKRIAGKHFIQSLAIAQTGLFNREIRMMDVGTGPGFPSLPLKILYPGIHLCLIEANRKKYLFLKEIVNLLKLEKVSIFCERVENLLSDVELIESFDVITARSVGQIGDVVRWSLPFLKSLSESHPRGVLVVPYGEYKHVEIPDDIDVTVREFIAKIDEKQNLRIMLFFR